MSDRLARLALARVCEPGDERVHAAIEAHGAESLWDDLRSGRRPPGVPATLVDGAVLRAQGLDPRRDLDALEACGARVVVPGDEEWPTARLTWAPGHLRDRDASARAYAPPWALFVRGPHPVAEAVELSAAVVGARAATAYGEHVARELGFGLAEHGVTVISGGAYGIDSAAHRGALTAASAPTVAVLACGVDVAYPRGHTRLLEQIAETGLVLSEWPPGASPTRVRFLVRNRVIAALSRGTVVVEAAIRSGSLSTSNRAAELDRLVLGVPGPITSNVSQGVHDLLRQSGTVLVRGWEDVLGAIGELDGESERPRRAAPHPRDALPQQVRRVLDAVPVRRGAGLSGIAQSAGLSTLLVQQYLPALVVAGLVERCDTGWRLTTLGASAPG